MTGARGTKERGAPSAPRKVTTYIFVLAALLLGGCSSSTRSADTAVVTNAETDSPRSRYMQACAQEEAFRKDKRAQETACECVFEAAKKRLNDVELEMLIANRSRNKVKRAEIRARTDYNEAAFHKNMSGLAEDSVACVVGKYAQ